VRSAASQNQRGEKDSPPSPKESGGGEASFSRPSREKGGGKCYRIKIKGKVMLIRWGGNVFIVVEKRKTLSTKGGARRGEGKKRAWGHWGNLSALQEGELDLLRHCWRGGGHLLDRSWKEKGRKVCGRGRGSNQYVVKRAYTLG